MTTRRVRWCHVLIGWLCLAAPVTADVRDTVKKLQSATVAIEWQSAATVLGSTQHEPVKPGTLTTFYGAYHRHVPLALDSV